jgi:hypothetical protein
MPPDAVDNLHDRSHCKHCDTSLAGFSKITSKKEMRAGFKSLKDAHVRSVGVQMHILALENISCAKSVYKQ